MKMGEDGVKMKNNGKYSMNLSGFANVISQA
jgi:hypothetical protein